MHGIGAEGIEAMRVSIIEYSFTVLTAEAVH